MLLASRAHSRFYARRQAYDAILKKYGARATGGKAAKGTNAAVTPPSALKRGRKRSATAEAEGNGKSGKRVKGKEDHEECQGDTGGGTENGPVTPKTGP